jgi:drug/metabolite transporter (DMT)-like permease
MRIRKLGREARTEANMTLVWLGALLVFGGVVFMAAQPLWRGRLSRARPLRSAERSDTLEPQRPATGFGIKSNWPGLALVVVGAVLLLAGAAF